MKRQRVAAAKGRKEFWHFKNLRRELLKKHLMVLLAGSTLAMSLGVFIMTMEMTDPSYESVVQEDSSQN